MAKKNVPLVYSNVPIKYTDRAFASIKQSLIEHAKRYYPNTFADFNEAGFGSLMLDTVSYIGDILSYYVDYQVGESFLDTAVEYNNVIRHGRQLGYRFRGNPSSQGIATFFIIAPVTSDGSGPNLDYAPVLKTGTTLQTLGETSFVLNEDVNFADPNDEVVVATVDPDTGVPTGYAIKASGQVISGEYRTITLDIGEFQKFRKIRMPALDIAEIVSVVDSEGNSYFEVDYLSQDVIYLPILNHDSSTKDQATNLLKPVSVPRRFVVERDRRATNLQFGYGSEAELSKSRVIDPASITLQLNGKDYIADQSFDPNRLMDSEKFGIGPANTRLTISYRINTTENVNVSAGSLSTVTSPVFEFTNRASLSTSLVNTVRASIEVTNDENIVGDVTLPDTLEVKRRIYDVFATQNRAVTAQDYKATVYSMPPQFGAIKRAHIEIDPDSFKRNLNLYVISESSTGLLAETNQTVKQNLKTWLLKNKMINDTIDILNAQVINLGIEFTILANDGVSKEAALNNAISSITQVVTQTREINEDFYITDLYSAMKLTSGVLDVLSMRVTNKQGGRYSDIRFDINDNTSSDGRYIICPKNAIFEIKYPLSDIKGTVK